MGLFSTNSNGGYSARSCPQCGCKGITFLSNIYHGNFIRRKIPSIYSWEMHRELYTDIFLNFRDYFEQLRKVVLGMGAEQAF